MGEPFRLIDGFAGVMYVPSGQLIAADPASPSWLIYQEWVAEGNEPEPTEEQG